MKYLTYLFAGTMFGIILTKSEAVSWFRIQEMFRFESFHMYGIILSAILVGMISLFILKKSGIKALNGEEIIVPDKKFNKGAIYGGLIFGMGWALSGACPGPLYALLGSGVMPVFVVILSALAGTWVYSFFRPRLPH
ncbi:MAG: YeeE/YedE family protein [Bacteroidetes bacterium]|nr:YeeE/YedE family protein [Bacteroidota bacterium]